MQPSIMAAPWCGFTEVLVSMGWMPAKMRPMVLAYRAVWGAETPAAAMAAGGIEG